MPTETVKTLLSVWFIILVLLWAWIFLSFWWPRERAVWKKSCPPSSTLKP